MDQLLKLDRKVLVVGRKEKPELPLPTGVTYFCNAARDATDLERILEGVDEIIDLAYSTTPQTSFTNPVHDITSNLPDSVRLFEIASRLPIQKFVWVSSGGTVYGNTAVSPIGEEVPTHPVSPYGITKLAIEKYARMYFEIAGLPIVCVRPSNAYGEGQKPFTGQGFISTAIATILNGDPITLFGEKGTTRDYIHVTDLAAGIISVLENGATGQVYNIATGVGHNNRQVIDLLSEFAKEHGLQIQLNIQPSRKFDVTSNVLSYNKLKEATGWKPQIKFEQGLERTWKWFVNQYKLV